MPNNHELNTTTSSTFSADALVDLQGLTRSDVDVSVTEVTSGRSGYVWLSSVGIAQLPDLLVAEAERCGREVTTADAQAAVAYLIALSVLVADELGRVPKEAAEGWLVNGKRAGYSHELPGGERWGWARKLFTDVGWVGLRPPSAGGDGLRLELIERRIWDRLHVDRPTRGQPVPSTAVPIQRGELRRLCELLNGEFTNSSRREHRKAARELYRVVDLLTGVVDDLGLLAVTGAELATRWGCSTGKVSDTRKWMLKHHVLVDAQERRPRHEPVDLAARQRTLPSAMAAYQALTGRSIVVRLRERERPTVEVDLARPGDGAFNVRTEVPSQFSGSIEEPSGPQSSITPLPTPLRGDARETASRGRSDRWTCSPNAVSKRPTRLAVEFLHRNARDAESVLAAVDDRRHGAATRRTLREVIAVTLQHVSRWQRTGVEPSDDLKADIEGVSRLVRRLHTISRDSATCQPDELHVALANPDDGPSTWHMPDGSVDVNQLVAVLSHRLRAPYDYAMRRRTGRQQGFAPYSKVTTHVATPQRELDVDLTPPDQGDMSVRWQPAETPSAELRRAPSGRVGTSGANCPTTTSSPGVGSRIGNDASPRRPDKRPWLGPLDGFIGDVDLEALVFRRGARR